MTDPKRIEQERKYDIFRNARGDLMIKIRARMDDVAEPVLSYDGGDHALLCRNPQNWVLLDYVHYGVKKDLTKAKEILIVEMMDEAIVREYVLPVQNVAQLPVSLAAVNA